VRRERCVKSGIHSVEQLSAAAAGGDPAAQERLALSYLEGWGVDRDYDKARDWYEKAAAQDDPGGHFGLAVLYALGWGVPTNEVEAYMHLVLMERRRNVLDERWNADTVKRMMATLEQVAGRLSESERRRAERLADDWTRAKGRA
jgi:hypothetical protein